MTTFMEQEWYLLYESLLKLKISAVMKTSATSLKYFCPIIADMFSVWNIHENVLSIMGQR